MFLFSLVIGSNGPYLKALVKSWTFLRHCPLSLLVVCGFESYCETSMACCLVDSRQWASSDAVVGVLGGLC